MASIARALRPLSRPLPSRLATTARTARIGRAAAVPRYRDPHSTFHYKL